MSLFRNVDREPEICVSSTFMSEADKMRIWDNRTALMNNLGIQKVLAELTQRKVFTAHENHLINQIKNRNEQTQYLFDLLQQKGGNAFNIFVAAVRKCHPALDDLLQSDIYQDDPSLLSLSPDTTIHPFQKKNRQLPNEPEEENYKLQCENFELKKKIKEIIQVNLRWQAYKEQSDDYICTLLQKLEVVGPPDVEISSNKPQQDATESSVEIWKENVQFTEEANKKLEEECKQLKTQLEESQSEQKNSETIIGLLQEELNEHHNTRRKPGHVATDDTEKIAILEQQLQFFKQDFEQERRDKQKAEIRQQELEHELLLIKQNPEQLPQKTMTSFHDPRDLGFIEDFHRHNNFEHGPVRHIVRRGIYQADGDDDEEDDLSVARAYSSSNHEDENTDEQPYDYTEFTSELAYIKQPPQYESD